MRDFLNVKPNIEHQRKSIDALLSLTKPEAGSSTIEELFQKAIGIIQEITGFETITARIYDPEMKCFRIMAQTGMAPEMIENLDSVSADSPNFAEIMKNREPTVKIPLEFVRKYGYKKTVFIPLFAGDTIIGSIDLPTKADYDPSQDELRWFALVGRILGSLIYQTQQTMRLQNIAVIKERTRLSNELHDDFAQCVRSMKWGLDDVRIALENNDSEKAEGILDSLEILVDNTASYLREEMLGLREKVDSNKGIIQVFDGMLSRFEKNWGIKTTLKVEGDVDTSYWNFMSNDFEIQLIRIIQEALMNVRRHAQAKSVTLLITDDEDLLSIKLKDDGVGFKMDSVPQDKLGLRVMKERASSVGAAVRFNSTEGKGTTIEIEFPLKAGKAQ